MDKLYIVMPAYNEAENIEAVVRAWAPLLADKSEGSKLLVADAGSTDGTHELLLALRESVPQLEILSASDKQHGPKLIALYERAIKEGADYIFQTDSDGQTDPAEFEGFWALRDDYDAILGYRKNRGDGRSRAMVEKVVCLLLRLYFGVNVPDANAPFRLMKSETVAKYLPRMARGYNLPNIMLTAFFAYYHEPMRFKTISFAPRKAGKTSVNLPRIIKIGLRSLADFWRFKKGL